MSDAMKLAAAVAAEHYGERVERTIRDLWRFNGATLESYPREAGIICDECVPCAFLHEIERYNVKYVFRIRVKECDWSFVTFDILLDRTES